MLVAGGRSRDVRAGGEPLQDGQEVEGGRQHLHKDCRHSRHGGLYGGFVDGIQRRLFLVHVQKYFVQTSFFDGILYRGLIYKTRNKSKRQIFDL